MAPGIGLVPCTAPRNSFRRQLDETGSITVAAKNRTGTSSFFVRRAWSVFVAASSRRTRALVFSSLSRRKEGPRARVLRHSTEHTADIVKASLSSVLPDRLPLWPLARSYVQNVRNSSRVPASRRSSIYSRIYSRIVYFLRNSTFYAQHFTL